MPHSTSSNQKQLSSPESVNYQQESQVQQQQGQQKRNQTGIPDAMKAGFEYSWGVSLEEVRVHYNSEVPAQQSPANPDTTQEQRGEGMASHIKGKNIYLAPEKEEHLGTALQQLVQQLRNTSSATPSNGELPTQPNNTGLPDQLKTGVENLSGYSMDDTKVHYNSSKPAEIDAHAYAEGSEIHLAPGQEEHLPHEAWHVVQQKQGRVKPTLQMKGKMDINNEEGLEQEATTQGKKAMKNNLKTPNSLSQQEPKNTKIAQRVLLKEDGKLLSNKYKYTPKIHYKKFNTTHNYQALKNMIEDGTNHNMTIKQAYASLKKKSNGSKPQSTSSLMKGEVDIEKDPDKNITKYSYETQGGSKYEDVEDTSTLGKRKRTTKVSNVSLQSKYRNNATPNKKQRILYNHYPKPSNFYKNNNKTPDPYAAAHKCPSFFNTRGGVQNGKNYHNVDETSESHNKRHSKFESELRPLLKKSESKKFSYHVSTEHSTIEDVDKFSEKVAQSKKTIKDKDRLASFYKKRKKKYPNKEHISKDKRKVVDEKGKTVLEKDIGEDLEMDLPKKFLSKKDKVFEDYKRGQYHGAKEFEIIESEGEDSELEEEAPKVGSKLDKAKPMTKKQMKILIDKLSYEKKKKRLEKKGEDYLQRLEDEYGKK